MLACEKNVSPGMGVDGRGSLKIPSCPRRPVRSPRQEGYRRRLSAGAADCLAEVRA